MKTFFIIWKIFCIAAVAIPGLLLFYRDWKTDKERNSAHYNWQTRLGFWGLIIAALAGFAGIWLDPFFSDRIARDVRTAEAPHPIVTVHEQSDSSIVIDIYSPTNNNRVMKSMSMSIDIPGKNAKCRILAASRVEDCSVTNSFRLGIAGDTVSERVAISCKSMLPSGSMRAQVDYDRTRRRPVPGSIEAGITNMFYLPVMDLRDYTPCLYTWFHNGQEILERSVVCLTNLTFIGDDNRNMKRHMQMEDWSPEARPPADQLWTDEDFMRHENERMDW